MEVTQLVRNRFYRSKVWVQMKLGKLADQPLCEYCLAKDIPVKTPAIEVDHVQPLQTHWYLRLEWDNLKSTCKPCHGLKHYTENLAPSKMKGKILNQRYKLG